VIVLPDTSVWVDYLRKGQSGTAWQLDELLRTRAVVVCGPVVVELLGGARRDDRDNLWALFEGLPWIPLERKEWRQVGEVAATLREQGMMVALTDIEIAVSAVSAGAAVWTHDNDFQRISRVVPVLQLFQPT
jgi:predicted nucleic acid-binding protein